ncbi:PGAM-domain-containing protein [Guyanagaster necrorhizus]|uniref:PGAM-domain-containing protein n=1 Tax=Guyanagaster necrorhizus TaxID=856835 RepID=A0A9P7W6J3_9AGAR|nr:PGAM-domain-containing protein [Guyanagaster necrorhizus MCA 3950]KAG7453194.1 PGAM-domain-containing protein [Guyanagaster necrorhizus MCA 3950]
MNPQEQPSNSTASPLATVEDTSHGSQKTENLGKCLILTLVRHGQSQSNVCRHLSGGRFDPLTDCGYSQAEQLSKDLSSMHIDHLISSPYTRALDTARVIGRNNIERPGLKPEEDELIIEQYHGPAVEAARSAGNGDLAYELRTGQSSFLAYGRPTFPPRSYSPPGGESLESVSRRARITLRRYLRWYGGSFSSMPDVPIDSTNLIDGVPHVVMVSHNIFLTEFYETMLFFNDPSQRYDTPVNWGNASWARYIVFYDGERLELKTMKQPS